VDNSDFADYIQCRESRPDDEIFARKTGSRELFQRECKFSSHRWCDFLLFIPSPVRTPWCLTAWRPQLIKRACPKCASHRPGPPNIRRPRARAGTRLSSTGLAEVRSKAA